MILLPLTSLALPLRIFMPHAAFFVIALQETPIFGVIPAENVMGPGATQWI